jgi:16S rRNA (guanine(966)-N(2))-methyltransferase RsmD
VRIIGGQWKRSKLEVLDLPGLRPTPDRVRETLFNWLGQELRGWRVLDAFAGTGALGFEAASRGADAVVLLEADPRAAAALQASRQRLGAMNVVVHRVDALSWLRTPSGGARFDLILLDPPFAERLQEAALDACGQHLSSQGWVYLEDDQGWDASALASRGWRLHRSGRAGAVHYHLLARLSGEDRLNCGDPAQE